MARGARHTLDTFRRVGAAATTLVLVALATVAFTPAPAAALCSNSTQLQPMPAPTGQPWPQRRWDLDRLAKLGLDGSGVTVAVIDSGVDARHPQLRGSVLSGWDAFAPGGSGQEDCVGHGTEVASLIAAQPMAGTPLRGLAPGVKILPLRASEHTEGSDSGRGGPLDVAHAIDQAVAHGAKVINLSLVLSEDVPEVRRAVNDALARNVVVVAAVGNGHNPNGGKDPTPYPAAYKGVIGVGAIGEDSTRYPRSQTGDYVSLVAPGAQIQAALPASGYQIFEGTSMAAPFVSAAAALVVQRFGKGVTPSQVATRLMATADPAPGPPGSPEYGQGVVNPYRATTAQLSGDPPAALPPLPGIRHDPAAVAAAAAAAQRRTIALWLAGGVGAVALLVVLVAVVLPRGRQRGWRPGSAG